MEGERQEERREVEEEPIVIEPEELGEEGRAVEEERLVVEVGPEEVEDKAPARPSVPSSPPFRAVFWRDPLFSKLLGGLIGGALAAAFGLLSKGLEGLPLATLYLSLLAALVATPIVALEGWALDLRGADVGALAVRAFVTGLVGGGLGGLCLHFLDAGGGLPSFLGRLLAFGLAGGAVGLGRRGGARPARQDGGRWADCSVCSAGLGRGSARLSSKGR